MFGEWLAVACAFSIAGCSAMRADEESEPMTLERRPGGFGPATKLWRSSMYRLPFAALCLAASSAQGMAQTKVGAEFLVNATTTNDQDSPTVAALGDGGFVIAWASNAQQFNYDIYSQRYAADGSAFGSENIVNTQRLQTQDMPSISSVEDGGYVVAWLSNRHVPNFPAKHDVYGQSFFKNNTRRGAEFHIDTAVHDDLAPRVAGLQNGRFVALWYSDGQSESQNSVYGQLYGANTGRIGGEFRVNLPGSRGVSPPPAVAALPNKGFVVAWSGWDPRPIANQNNNCFVRLYGANGSPVSGALPLPVSADTQHQIASVGAFANGHFIVVFITTKTNTVPVGIFARRFDGEGRLLDRTAISIDSAANIAPSVLEYGQPSLAILKDGGAVMIWSETVFDYQGKVTGTPIVYGRRFDAGLQPLGGKFQVNTNSVVAVNAVTSVAALTDGGYIAAWEAKDPVPNTQNNRDIYAQRFAK